MQFQIENFLEIAIEAALQAGAAIMQVYSKNFAIEYKEDLSPLTLADKQAHLIIDQILQKTELPILSEEGKSIPYSERKNWDIFWLVDPLDGTKEFIAKSGEFTVNIALIEKNFPILGVIYAPVKQVLYFAEKNLGAFKAENIKNSISFKQLMLISKKLPLITKRDTFTVVASKNHLNQETLNYINSLKQNHGEIHFISAGSSLKFCLVAEGLADEYPRLGPTMEWDSAAGHAIINSVGKKVINKKNKEISYNKENLLNEFFYVL